MELGLQGRRALVTGGSRGVGRAVSLALAAHGVDVITCYRKESVESDSLERELGELGGRHRVLRADLSDPEQAVALTAEAERWFGGLDLVVNNAADAIRKPYAELSFADWNALLAGNLDSVHLVIQRAIGLMGDGGSVVSIGSQAVDVGVPALGHYAASKAALLGLNHSLAREFGHRGIRFNVLSLGMIETERIRLMTPDRLARYRAATALGRLGTPEDVAGAVLWLASDLARFVTGAVIPVDGGTA